MTPEASVNMALMSLEEDEHKTRAKRAYVALAFGAVFYVFTIWYEVYVDTRKSSLALPDPFLQSHRQWRLRTAFLYLVWSILAGFCVPFGVGGLVFVPVWAWYVYRVIRGAFQFSRGRKM